MMVLYSAALALGLLLGAPWWLLRMITTERYREGLGQRLGSVPDGLRAAVAGKRVVWLHAVSVGEVLAASRLVTELEAALNARAAELGAQQWMVVISTTTRTGQALARERFGAERVFYFPLDFAFAVGAYMRVLRPAALVLMESELWPRVLHECQRSGVPVAVVNARVSDRSFARAMRVRSVWGRVLTKVPLWLAQSEEDARRLVAMGARQDAVRVGGNLKYDVRVPKDNPVARQIKQWAGERKIIVAGSTCEVTTDTPPGEEEGPLVEACYQVVREQQRALLVLAPRHPERFERAESAIVSFWYRNASGRTAQNPPEEHPVEVVLLDTIGDLAAVYSVADIAFVGGSLVPRGGHNPLEPAQFGVPVIMGPSFENFRDIVRRMQAVDSIRILQNEEELQGAVEGMLAHPDEARAMGERGRRVFQEQGGATGRTVRAIVEKIEMMENMQGTPQ